jgi:transcriptional regulator with PAS, ATPase and Fis domain
VSINCAALPEGLLESELFGIEKGVATGVHQRQGKLEQAQGGSFFLDEIGEMSLALQAKLLRVVENREVERVGARSSIHVDVRLIAATNRNLEQAIAAKRFREDLYYRLNVVPIVLPPLRERREDVPLLVEHFLRKHGDAVGREVQGLTRDALDLLVGAPWPGNVRELENVIQRALLMADGPMIRAEDLPSEMSEHGPELIQRAVGEGWTTDRLVKEYAVRALERNKGNLSRTARELGMDFKTLKKKVEEYKRDHFPGSS